MMLRRSAFASAARFVERRSFVVPPEAFKFRSSFSSSTPSNLSASTKENDIPDLFLPRITEKRLNEAGPGGRSSNAGIKVAIFGATGFVGKHLCHNLGTFFWTSKSNVVYFLNINRSIIVLAPRTELLHLLLLFLSFP